jgi:uncharacterized protein
MPHGALRTPQDCDDLVTGCTFMGTGGGGSAELGRQLLRTGLESGLTLEWTDASDLPDELWTCTTYSMGSIAPETKQTERARAALGLRPAVDAGLERAVRELGAYTGLHIGALVPVELGAENTPAPLAAAMRLGIPLVDGDYAGRAVPEEVQGTPYLHEKPSHPLVSVDPWGDVVVLKEACSPLMLERIGKMLTVAAHSHCFVAATLLPASEMKQIVVRGTITRSFELGRAIRRARRAGGDPVAAALDVTGGWLLFRGRVAGKDWEDRDGYMLGTTTIEGRGEWSGRTLAVWFKNENQVSWLDGEPWVTSPDLVVLADPKTGEGYSNPGLAPGDEVVAIGIRGLDGFRSEQGLAGAGPRYFGFDVDYVPIEELVAR